MQYVTGASAGTIASKRFNTGSALSKVNKFVHMWETIFKIINILPNANQLEDKNSHKCARGECKDYCKHRN